MARIVSRPTDVEAVGAAAGLGAVVDVQHLARGRRLLLAADALSRVTLVAAFVVFGSRSGWLGALAAAIGAVFVFTRGTSDAWVESYAVRLCVSLTALAVLVVAGWLVRGDRMRRPPRATHGSPPTSSP